MDRELIAHLDAKLEGFTDRIDAKLEGFASRIDSRIAGVDRRLDDLQSQMDSRFGEVDSRFGEMQVQMDSRFDETQEQNRHTHVLLEKVRSQVQLLAEGHAAQDEKLDRRFDQVQDARRTDRDHLEAMMKGLFISLSRRDDELEERLEAAGH